MAGESPGARAKITFYPVPVRLSYDDAGRGECVVLIHGHPFDRTLWEPQLAALRGRGRGPDYRPLLAALDIPALVVAGTADPWSNSEVTAEIVSSPRRPELVVIEGSGHLPNLEAEAQFNEALLTFLSRHVP